MSRTFLACLARTSLLALPQHPINHTVIVTSDLDDHYGVCDREVVTVIITNERADVDADEDVATAITIRHGGEGDVEVVDLENGADDGAIVMGETMVIIKRCLQHTKPIDIDVITAIVIVDATEIAVVSTCSEHLLHVVAMPRATVVIDGLLLDRT